MTTTVRDVMIALENIAPLAGAEAWDNVGLIIGDPSAACRSALLTIDLTPEVMAEAKEKGASFVVAYHPPMFRAVKQLHARDLGYEAARAGLSVYSPHTAFDRAQGGTTDCLAAALELIDVAPLGTGSARVGKLARSLSFEELASHTKRVLSLDHVIVSGSSSRRVERVVVCAGAGGSFVDEAAIAKADAIVAGELSHHDVLRAQRSDVATVCTFHTNTERLALAPLAARLKSALPAVTFTLSQADRDPCRVA